MAIEGHTNHARQSDAQDAVQRRLDGGYRAWLAFDPWSYPYPWVAQWETKPYEEETSGTQDM